MYSTLLLALAALDVGFAFPALRAWRRSGSKLLAFDLAALLAVALATLLAGIGHRLGPGDQLRDLHALPVLIALVTMPLTLFAQATLARRLELPWARNDWSHGVVCLYATALLVLSLPELLHLKALHAGCWRDVVWYERVVTPALACAGVPRPEPALSAWPLVIPSVLIGWGVLGVGLWRRDRWPWLLAGTAGGGVLLLLPASWGPLPWLLGLSLAFVAIGLAGARHADVMQAPAPVEPGVSADG